jgi:hypothetical protein
MKLRREALKEYRMLSLVELTQGESVRGCRPRRRDYFELRTENPVSAGIELLGRIREAARSPDPEDGIEFIYSEFDSRFSKGLFVQINEVLGALDPAKSSLPVLHLLAIASITYAAKDQLGSRAAFLTRVRTHLERADADRVEELLAGIE